MHGTASWFSMAALSRGGGVVTLDREHFEVGALLDVATQEAVSGLCIVGDAFARPIVQALDAEPARWDLSPLRVVFSSGVMFSGPTKQGLLRHAPRAVVVDSLGSSESGVIGRSVSRSDGVTGTARF